MACRELKLFLIRDQKENDTDTTLDDKFAERPAETLNDFLSKIGHSDNIR